MCPHRPLHTPTALSAWSTIAAPCGWSLAASPRCPRTFGTAPVSSFLLLHQHHDRFARMVEHPTEVVTSTHERPSLRGVVRTRPDRGPDGASPAGDRGWEAGPGTASSPTRPGRSLARPTAADLAVHSHPAEPLPPRSQCHTGRETCPGGQREGPGCPGPSKEGMRRPSPAPAEGATTAYGGDQGRGLFAWLVLPRSGRRRGRYSLGGPSPRGLPSSPVARSTKPPAWCRVGAEARHGEEVCRESLGVPPSSQHLAVPGVRTVPRAED